MSKFFTRTGDDGYTQLLGKGRVSKDDPRLEAIGAIDEANAALAITRATCKSYQCSSILLEIQRDLYNIMAEISFVSNRSDSHQIVDSQRVKWLEDHIECLGTGIENPKEFITPGDTEAQAYFDMARVIVRRAERRVVHLWQKGYTNNQNILHYLNRLSTLCYVLELLENQVSGVSSPTLAKGT